MLASLIAGHATRKVSSVERVYEELLKGDDQLSEWGTRTFDDLSQTPL